MPNLFWPELLICEDIKILHLMFNIFLLFFLFSDFFKDQNKIKIYVQPTKKSRQSFLMEAAGTVRWHIYLKNILNC